LIIDDEIREALGENRFDLPDGHPAHRRMRELLMTEGEIREWERRWHPDNQDDEQPDVEPIRWNHEQLAELGLVKSLSPRSLPRPGGFKPAWFNFRPENIDDLQQEDADLQNHEPVIEEYSLRMGNIDELLLKRPSGVSANYALTAIQTPLGAALEADGAEALAWYIPFHDTGGEWGIYIREVSPRIIANKYLSDINPIDAHELAANILFAHEYFHHISEIACTTLEDGNPRSDLYRDYFDRLVSDSDYPLEEALANANALEYADGNRKAVRSFMNEMPRGYRDYWEYFHREERARGYQQLASMYAGESFSSKSRNKFGNNLFHIPSDILKHMRVPVHWVKESTPIHLGKSLPMVNFREIIVTPKAKKRLRKLGDPILQKKFYKAVDKLRALGKMRHAQDLHQCDRPDWWKYNLGKSGDAHGNPRFFLVEKGNYVWEIPWVGRHPEYTRYRKKHSL